MGQVGQPLCVVGRYALYGKLAAGGMATVHFGRLLGPAGFSRTVAIKRLHPEFAKDPEFVAMFLDEARLAARIQHPNVVATVDVVAMAEELFLVMDYIRGEAFSRLLRGARRQKIPVDLGTIGSIVSGMLHGLHAAHEARDERGQPLGVVHRDVSPQNVLVGVDGVARVLDFGVAKAAARVQVTRDGQMKGKVSYMAPEQLRGHPAGRTADIFAAGVVIWEAITSKRLFTGGDAASVAKLIVSGQVPAPSSAAPGISKSLDEVVLRALAKEPADRYPTAREFVIALENAIPVASNRAVGEWVERVAGATLLRREETVAELESISSVSEVSARTSDPEFLRPFEGGSMSLGELAAGQRLMVRAKRAGMLAHRSTEEVAIRGHPPQPADEAPTRVDGRRALISDENNAITQARPPEGGEWYRRAPRRRRLAWLTFGVALTLIASLVLVRLVEWSWNRSRSASVGPETRGASLPTKSTGTQQMTGPRGADEAKAAKAKGLSTADLPPTARLPVEGDDGSGEPTFDDGAKEGASVSSPSPSLRSGGQAVDPETTQTAECKQPFRIDQEGIRRIKAECL